MDDSQFLTGDTHSPHFGSGIELHDIDLIPPSPPSQFADVFDIDGPLSDILSPPPGAAFPHTPSYGSGPGSIQGSPGSAYSDLDFSDDPTNSSLLLYPDYQSEYNPSDFDHASPHYMMFPNTLYGDYSSPSSNGGSPHIAPASLQASPRLEVQQSFENMSFNNHSPNWGTDPLPGEARPSPPRLMMPDDEAGYQPPSINAPDGDGPGGPRLQVVPATPVSGGRNNNGSLYMRQGQQQSQPTWNQSTPSPAPPAIRQQNATQQIPQQQQEPFSFPSRPPSSTSLYIPPTAGRSRSKSDSSPGGHPTWDTLGLGGGGLGLSGVSSSFKDESAVSDQTFSFNDNQYLSPSDSNSVGLRRSRSELAAGNRPGHLRASRSDDFGASGYLMPPDQYGNFLTPGMSMNMNNMGSGALMGLEGGMGRGRHVRRASSGSRSERGISSHDASPANSNRASPYPSPNVSPRGRYEELPAQVNVGGQAIPLNVSKQNVTTGRTKAASHNRRKQEASFVCPVPGCGSTFTRSFNLKGHIRSHNEEKPFLCPWPGCGKGFARQHDCKRHEQLHSNYRPFQCEGCQKPFARMDALNRHLRSEGGADCAKLLEGKGQTLPLMQPKMELMPKMEDWESGL